MDKMIRVTSCETCSYSCICELSKDTPIGEINKRCLLEDAPKSLEKKLASLAFIQTRDELADTRNREKEIYRDTLEPWLT